VNETMGGETLSREIQPDRGTVVTVIYENGYVFADSACFASGYLSVLASLSGLQTGRI